MTRYWYVAGQMAPDNTLSLRRGYIDERPRRSYEGISPLRLEFLDAAGALRLAYPIALRRPCTEGESPLNIQRSFRAWVPLPDGVDKARFVYGDAVLHELELHRASPELHLLSEPPRSGMGEFPLRWEVSHPENKPVEFFCRYSNDDGTTWFRLGPRTKERSAVISLDALAGGERCRVAVVATDGFGTAVATTPPFPVAVKPFVAMILRPALPARVEEGTRLDLLGQGYELETRRPIFEGLVWSSSKDGILGEGASIVTPPLSKGEHLIRLAVGTGGRRGEAEVRVFCGKAAEYS